MRDVAIHPSYNHMNHYDDDTTAPEVKPINNETDHTFSLHHSNHYDDEPRSGVVPIVHPPTDVVKSLV
jgi:hypothetical protein